MKPIIHKLFLLLALLISGGFTGKLGAQTTPRVQVIVNKFDQSITARELIYDRFTQASSLNDMGSTNSRFVLIVRPTLISSEVIQGTPSRTMSEIELSCFLIDGLTRKIITSHSIKLTGIDLNEKAAITDAIITLQARDPALKRFLTRTKEQLTRLYSQEELTKPMPLSPQLEQDLNNIISAQ